MKNKYEVFWEREQEKSLDFLRSLALKKEDVLQIDNWFFSYLEFHSKSHSFKDGMKYENKLRQNFYFSESGKQSDKYVLGKLIKYYNISMSGYLKGLLVARLDVLLGDLIREYIGKKISYFPAEFIALTRYLESSVISPNGDLIENILKIESINRICTKATISERSDILMNVLKINANKGFHHDIKCYKKVLNLIEENDMQLINHIYKYKVVNDQGCYQIIKMIFDFDIFTDKCRDFNIKRALIICFDFSSGSTPKENWRKKAEDITKKVELKKLSLLCDEILNHEGLKNYYFTNTYWSDDVAKRLIKSAKWIKELN